MKHYRIIDQPPIKSKRLTYSPMNAKELSALIERETDEWKKARLDEKRRGMADDPDQALWHTGWRITVKKTGETVGWIGFRGAPEDRTAAMEWHIDPRLREEGFDKEAAKRLSDWALTRESVYFVQVQADEDDTALNEALRELKYYRVESPIQGKTHWELERPASAWLAIYLCIGLGAGISLGSALFDSEIIGMAIGAGAGLSLGAGMDAQDRAARKREHAPNKLDAK